MAAPGLQPIGLLLRQRAGDGEYVYIIHGTDVDLLISPIEPFGEDLSAELTEVEKDGKTEVIGALCAVGGVK